MTTLHEDLAVVQDKLSKLGIQNPFTIVLSKDDYRDLERMLKVDPDWWKTSQFMDTHFTWQSITFRR